jgi:hypothetical protein
MSDRRIIETEHDARVDLALSRARATEFTGDVRVHFTKAHQDRKVLADEVERLQSKVNELEADTVTRPKTPDGALIQPGHAYWAKTGAGVVPWNVTSIALDEDGDWWVENDDDDSVPPGCLFLDHDAAEAAGGE